MTYTSKNIINTFSSVDTEHILGTLDNYSARELVETFMLHLQSKETSDPASLTDTCKETDKKRICDEYNILHNMFVCSTRYIHSLGDNEEGEYMYSLKKQIDDIRGLYNRYCDCLDLYCLDHFGKDLYALRREEVLNIEIDGATSGATVDDCMGERIISDIPLFDFSLPEGLSGKKLMIEVNRKAMAFCNAITRYMGKKPCDFIRSMDFAVISRITIICLLADYLDNRKTNLWEIAACINNFDRLKPLLQFIEDYYGICIDVDGKDVSGKDNWFYPILLFVKAELLGPAAPEIFNQTRELSNVFFELLHILHGLENDPLP